MTATEGIAGLIASVIAIIGALILVARFLGRKFDRWIQGQVANTEAVRTLTLRVFKLEQAFKNGSKT